MAGLPAHGPIGALTEAIANAPVAYKALALGAVILLFSRAFLPGRRNQTVKQLPWWLPLEIAITAHFVPAGGLGRRILSLFRRNGGPLFGLTSVHQVLYDYENVDRLFTKQYKSLSIFGSGWTLMVRVFGVNGTDEVLHKLQACLKGLYRPVEQVFVGEQGSHDSVVRGDVPGKALNLVTLSANRKDMQRWERSANVRVVTPGVAAEADLHSLTRDFGACISIPLLYGQQLLDLNPTLLDDFWTFDNELFPLLVVGLPTWVPMKAMRDGLAARTRLLQAMEACYARIDQWQRGDPIDGGADMSDVSYIAQERNRVYAKHEMPVWARGQIDFSLLWGQNANSQALTFWFIAYLYSTPGLVEELRREIADYVKVSDMTDPPQITAFDVAALSHSCPLLKSCLIETFRLTNEGTSIRYVADSVTIEDGGKQYRLKPGSWISAPHGARQHDPELYPEPGKFQPDRFLETDSATGRRTARYGRLRPWGSGHGICKGRTLAEKEILAIGAAVMALWDIEPAGSDKTWKLPGMRPGTGVMVPTEDVRVVLRRRVFS